jgi:hypothetical protein
LKQLERRHLRITVMPWPLMETKLNTWLKYGIIYGLSHNWDGVEELI